MRQLLGRPSCFELPFTEQLSKPHRVGFSLELLNACIDVGHLVVVLSVVSDVSGNAPIVQLLGSVDECVEYGRLTNEELVEPLGNGVNGLRQKDGGSMDRDKIGVGLGALFFSVGQHHAFIGHLDPFGGAVQAFANGDLKIWVVDIAFVAVGSSAVAFFIVSKLVFQSLVTVVG